MLKPNSFYKLSDDYIKIANQFGAYRDNKERPIYCCFQDSKNPDIYWLVPTSDIAHRSPQQVEKIKRMCALKPGDIRSCYYHIGKTNKPAIFKISNVLPVTEKYIKGEYTVNNIHLELKNKSVINEILRKLRRILFVEEKNPNKFEQHITDLYNYLLNELQQEKTNSFSSDELSGSVVSILETTEISDDFGNEYDDEYDEDFEM